MVGNGSTALKGLLGAICFFTVCGNAVCSTSVQLVQPVKGSVSESLQTYGTIDSNQKITLLSKTTGTLTTYVGEGDLIKSGTLVATIFNPQLKNGVINAQNQVSLSQIDLTTAKRQLAQGTVLYKINAIAKDDFITLQNAGTRASISLQSAQQSLIYAQEQLGYTKVTSPIAGKVISVMSTSGSDISSGAQLVQIADMNQLFVNLSISQSYIKNIKQGQSVVLSAGTFQGTVIGTIENISQKVDKAASPGQKPSITIKASCKPTDPNDVLIGSFVMATITTNQKNNVWTLPVNAIWGNRTDGYYVVTQNGNKYQKQMIKIGISDQQNVEITSPPQSLKNVVIANNMDEFLKLSNVKFSNVSK